MNRRGVPPISRSDLRDHATPERIERIWEQIEADLPSSEASTSSPQRLMFGVAAAVAASLAGGLLLGKLIWDQPLATELSASPTIASAAPDPASGVFAAGTRGQSFDLPGGGQLVLSPGATVEVVRQQGDTLELRLVQGEATINTTSLPPRQLVAVFAGEATLSTQGGGVLRVRRNAHDLDVSVGNGHVSVRSPDGEQSLMKGQHARAIPLRSIRPTARVVPQPRGSVGADPERLPLVVPEPVDLPVPLPDWRARGRAGDVADALRMLREQPRGIDGAIQSAADADALWEIHDIAFREDPGAAYRALTRVAEAFPGDASAQLAAYKLGNYYRGAGQHDLANKWFARAAESSDGVLAEDALCKQFRTAPNEEEALRFAQEYLAKYPDGRCKHEAERRMAGDSSEDEADQDPPSEAQPDAGAK